MVFQIVYSVVIFSHRYLDRDRIKFKTFVLKDWLINYARRYPSNAFPPNAYPQNLGFSHIKFFIAVSCHHVCSKREFIIILRGNKSQKRFRLLSRKKIVYFKTKMK